ncbi:hypothetical protein [Streptomyces coerulescens]|uniref:Uncharacterized protein n=1 Tax=Streptomyces coerulescens TaxID=29304 RepID=A0ABW0CKG2_STRCD
MYPMQPTPPFQAPYGQRPNASGHPVGAVFLGFFASVVVSLLYSGLILATYEDLTVTQANTMYLVHALINGAIVGCLIGLVGHRNTGAHVSGAVIAAAGAFFGFTNALPLIIADRQSPAAIGDMMEADPFIPAKAWWNNELDGGVDWFSPSACSSPRPRHGVSPTSSAAGAARCDRSLVATPGHRGVPLGTLTSQIGPLPRVPLHEPGPGVLTLRVGLVVGRPTDLMHPLEHGLGTARIPKGVLDIDAPAQHGPGHLPQVRAERGRIGDGAQGAVQPEGVLGVLAIPISSSSWISRSAAVMGVGIFLPEVSAPGRGR